MSRVFYAIDNFVSKLKMMTINDLNFKILDSIGDGIEKIRREVICSSRLQIMVVFPTALSTILEHMGGY